MPFIDIKKFKIRHEDQNIEFDAINNNICYYNTTRPTGDSFPPHYFDKKYCTIRMDEAKRVEEMFDVLSNNVNLRDLDAFDYSDIGVGFSVDDILFVDCLNGDRVGYSDCYVFDNELKREKLDDSFVLLFNYLSSFCEFEMPYPDIDFLDVIDDEDFDATLLLCSKCGESIPPYSPSCPYCGNVIKW